MSAMYLRLLDPYCASLFPGALLPPTLRTPRRFLTMKSFIASLIFVLTLTTACFLLAPALHAQSLTSGAVIGTVTDPSGAAVPNATVTLKNNDTGATQSTTTTGTGAYRFALLNPGSYSVSTKAQGFQGMQQKVNV